MDQVEPTEPAPRRWRLLCLATVLVLAACGGGGGEDRSADDADDRTTSTADEGPATTSGESTTSTTGPAPTSPPAPAAPGAPGEVGTQLGVDRPFTGEGSEAFCGEMRAVQTSLRSGDPAQLDEAAVTGQLAQLTPPAEIAADWTLMVTVQQQLSTSQDPDPLASIDQAQLDAYGTASAVVAAYLGDVCQLDLLG